MDYIYGIDLGTTNSAVAVNLSGVAEIVPVEEYRTTPSVVRYNTDGTTSVGHSVYRTRHEDDHIYSAKRDMGTDKVYTVKLKDGTEKKVKPYQVGGEVLRYMKDNISSQYPPLKKAVITVPAYFNSEQRTDTMAAAKEAGIDCVRIINEPTAAALCYAHDHFTKGDKTDKFKTYLVIDCGGGTTDITLITIAYINNVPELLAEVINPGYNFFTDSTGGNNYLGGDDYDNLILQQLEKDYNIKFKNPRETLLFINANKPNVLRGNRTICVFPDPDNKDIQCDINLSLMKKAFQPFWDKIQDCIYECLKDKAFPPECILVGGSTKNPFLVETINKFYISRYQKDIDLIIPDNSFADESVALGASYLAAFLANPDNGGLTIRDVNPLPIGLEVIGTDALGNDVPHQFYPFIGKDITLPVSKTIPLSTVEDNQEEFELKVFQGINGDCRYNHFLGTLLVPDLDKAPAEEVSIDVNIAIDYNGEVKVTAIYKDNVYETKISSILTGEQKELPKMSIKDRINVGFMKKARTYYIQQGNTEMVEWIDKWVFTMPIHEEILAEKETINALFKVEVAI